MDEVAGAVLTTLAQYGCSYDGGLQALRSAEVVLREVRELEQSFFNHGGGTLLILPPSFE